MLKWIWFDMDGTLADLYGVENWLPKLRNEDSTPYAEAAPMVDISELNQICNQLRKQDYKIGVISWLSMDATQSYKKEIRQAKREWLSRNGFQCDKIHLVQYGTPKHKIAGPNRRGILYDDSKEVGLAWAKSGGVWINVKQQSIIDHIQKVAA